jgi:flagellin
MVMSIRTNVSSLEAQRHLSRTQVELDSSLAKLSSGFRITKAGDDAAGLGISSNLQAQIRGFNQAVRNSNDGISVVQTAEGALGEVTNILARLRELAVQSASDGVGDTERGYIQTEAADLLSELDRIANSTEFNGTKLLDGGASGGATTLDFQVGIRYDAAAPQNDVISISIGDATANTLFGGASPDLHLKAGAQSALDVIDSAIDTVSQLRAGFGAVGNRLQSAVATIQSQSENLSAANSRIMDVDVAEETSAMSREQVLMQAGVSVLAQANQMPQLALKLLG